VVLDGFLLLEAADEELPEAVQAAVLAGRGIGAVQAADLPYFLALRSLDVSDNALPSLAALGGLPDLRRLRAASCRLSGLGSWAPDEAGKAEGEVAEADAPAPVPPPAPPAPFLRLEVLDLSYNALPASLLLPGGPLAALPRLAELDLSANGLRQLPAPAAVAHAAAAAAGEGGAHGPAFPSLRKLRLADNALRVRSSPDLDLT
jgi:Leucine-rich repeat (LRR) protein